MGAKPVRTVGGLQSIDLAVPILLALSRAGRPCSLTELGKATGMSTSKLHRYVTSFVNAGIIEQNSQTRLYDLGPTLMRLGVSALGRNRFTRRAIGHLPELVEETSLAAHVSVWGNHGPVVVSWERQNYFPPVNFGLGSTLALLDSAAGRVFLAFLPEDVTSGLLKAELRIAREARRQDGWETAAFRKRELARVREGGCAAIDWPYRPSICAIAAPVLNWQNEVTVVVTLVGMEHQKSILEPQSQARRALERFVGEIGIKAEAG